MLPVKLMIKNRCGEISKINVEISKINVKNIKNECESIKNKCEKILKIDVAKLRCL